MCVSYVKNIALSIIILAHKISDNNITYLRHFLYLLFLPLTTVRGYKYFVALRLWGKSNRLPLNAKAIPWVHCNDGIV